MAELINVNKKLSFDPNTIEIEKSSLSDVLNDKQLTPQRRSKTRPSLERSRTFLEEYFDSFNPKKRTLDETVKKIRLDGIEALSMATTTCAKVFWMIMICLACVTTVFYLYKTISEFWYSKPITTFNVIPMTELNFPQIFICPYVDRLDFGFADTQQLENETTEFLSCNQTDNEFSKIKYDVNTIFTSCVLKTFSQNENISCSSIIRQIYDVDQRQQCFLINFVQEKQRISGRGLLLGLDLTETSRDPCLSAKGANVIIAQSYNYGSRDSTYVGAGTFTDLSLTAQRHQFMDVRRGPYPQPCVSEEKFRFTFMAGNYTRGACLKDCEIKTFFHSYSCIPEMDSYFLQKNVTYIPFCTKEFIEKIDKNSKFQQDLQKCQSQCHENCQVWRYAIQNSFQPLYGKKFNSTTSWRNLIYLHVAFGEMEVDEYVQSPSKTADDVISDIGGQVNLWLGASMVTLIQIPTLISVIVAWSVYGNVHKVQRHPSKYRRTVSKLFFGKK